MSRVRTWCGALVVAAAVLAGAAQAADAAVLAGAAPAAEAARMVSFSSPSRNIGCELFQADHYWIARCDIRDRYWPNPRHPRRCHLDYGQGVYVSGHHHRAAFVCAGDTALGAKRVLRYGHALRRGTLLCTSLTIGMRCVNVRNGHGFLLSRESVKRF